MKSQRSTSVEFPVIQTIICLHSKWKWKVRGGGKRGQEKLTQRLHEILKNFENWAGHSAKTDTLSVFSGKEEKKRKIRHFGPSH